MTSIDRLQALALSLASAGHAFAEGGAIVILMDKNPRTTENKDINMKVATAGIPTQFAVYMIIQQVAKNFQKMEIEKAIADVKREVQ